MKDDLIHAFFDFLETVLRIFLVYSIPSVIPAIAWFGFDDTLATVVGFPPIGALGFWEVWAATLFIFALLRRIDTSKRDPTK